MRTLLWLRDVAGIPLGAALFVPLLVVLVAIIGTLWPSARTRYTVALAEGFEAVGRQLRGAVAP